MNSDANADDSGVDPALAAGYPTLPGALAGLEEHSVEDGARGLLDALLAYAVEVRASDVHLDPSGRGWAIRLRIDGVMHHAYLLARPFAERLINQIKSAADLDPITIFHPEEASWQQECAGQTVGLRLTILPVVAGVKLALRLLYPGQIEHRITALGMGPGEDELIHAWSTHGDGLLLVAGPTGSGKTTTMYAILHDLAADGFHVVSVEDPVETPVPGTTQVELDRQHGLDFDVATRSVIRLDPDCLALGEVRERDSARACGDAVSEGRSVLTTIHAHDAAAAIARLRHFGIDRYELAANLGLIVDQRLVRRLCPECRRPHAATDADRKWLQAVGLDPDREAGYEPVGCEVCAGVGYRGRTGIFSFHSMRSEDLEAIYTGEDEASLRARLTAAGPDLPRRVLERIADGTTSLAEARTVVKWRP